MADLLRDRHEADACAFQLAAVMLEQMMVLEQPREAIHPDVGDPPVGPQRVLKRGQKARLVLGRVETRT